MGQGARARTGHANRRQRTIRPPLGHDPRHRVQKPHNRGEADISTREYRYVRHECDTCHSWAEEFADTQFYWNLTKHIFRYNHMSEDGMYNGAHTINEGRPRHDQESRH